MFLKINYDYVDHVQLCQAIIDGDVVMISAFFERKDEIIRLCFAEYGTLPFQW